MIRALLIVALLLLSIGSSYAAGRHPGGGTAQNPCSFLGSTTNLSCIPAANTTNVLQDEGSRLSSPMSMSYTPNVGFECGDSSGNCANLQQPFGTSIYLIGYSTQATLCFLDPSDSYFYLNKPTVPLAQDNWYQVHDYGGGGYYSPDVQAVKCSPPPLTFLNNTIPTPYSTFGDLCAGARNNDALEVQAQPAGMPGYTSACTLTTNNNSLQLDAGAIFINATTDQGTIKLIGSGTSITAPGGALIEYNAGASNCSNCSAIKVVNGAQNISIAGASGHPIEMFRTQTGILTGDANNDNVTISYVYAHSIGQGIDNVCADDTQDHDTYIGASPTPPYDSGTKSVSYSTLADNICDGWNLKSRAIQLTVSYVYMDGVTAQSAQNAVMDSPCGGQYEIDHSLFGIAPNGNGNQYLSRGYEEVEAVGCAPYGIYPVYDKIYVKDWFFQDQGDGGSSAYMADCSGRYNFWVYGGCYSGYTAGGFLGFQGVALEQNGNGGGAISSSATSMTVASTFLTAAMTYSTNGSTQIALNTAPSAPFDICWDDTSTEIATVGSVSGTTWSSLTRGAYGTTAASHTDGAIVHQCEPPTQTTPTASVNNSQTCITPTSTSNWPAPPFLIAWGDTTRETTQITSLSGGSCSAGQWTVARGLYGTTASAHTSATTMSLLNFWYHRASQSVLVGLSCGGGGDTMVWGNAIDDGTNTSYCDRATANSVFNWCGGGSGSCSNWPFYPALMTDNMPGRDQQVAQAHNMGFCGDGTQVYPIQPCEPAIASNDNLIRVASNGNEVWAPKRAVDYYPFARNGSLR